MTIRKTMWLALAAAAGLGMGSAAAQDQYPSEAIEFIVPFGAGGGFDTLARRIAEPLAEELDVPVVVKNMPGSGGRKGSIDLFRSEPDGYTIGLPHFVPFITDATLLGKEPPIDFREFEPIQMVASAKHFIYVPDSSSVEAFADLKEMEGTPKFTSTGVGSNAWTHVTALANAEGIDVDFVHGYESLVAAALGAVRGDADGGVGGMHQLSGMMDDLRPIAYFHQDRSPNFPDTPTVVELGYPELADLSSPYVVSAPPGTPEEKLAVIREALRNVVHSEEYEQWIDEAGYVLSDAGPEETWKILGNMEGVYGDLSAFMEEDQ